ncbi:rhodanese-like domain-containing protein [Actinomadura coerulea]|uniref:rhodanese-like domain-containing protein n=1 Tax=Actinomadura coerulea TaxID=46159 RepID=UPI001C87EA11
MGGPRQSVPPRGVRPLRADDPGGRSALAAQTLQALGYTDVAHLDGGLAAWKEQGRPVTFAAEGP